MLYGSETGNAEALAGVFATELKRRGVRASCMAMDDFDFDDLPNQGELQGVEWVGARQLLVEMNMRALLMIGGLFFMS